MTPLDALQQTLAAQHAAVYVYGVLGGRTSQSATPELWEQMRASYTRHRGRRDQLLAMVRSADGEPVAGAVSYAMPNAARTVRQIIAAARTTEERCCAVYADMVGSTAGANRQWAIDATTDAAVRQLGFRGRPEIFPGITEL